MAEVVWSRRALQELASITAYVGHVRPMAAERLAERLKSAANALGENPMRGRAISRGRRELIAVRPYLIRYVVSGDFVHIRGIRHGARAPD